jgi:thiol-disulfide isomerase/thioredoxin
LTNGRRSLLAAGAALALGTAGVVVWQRRRPDAEQAPVALWTMRFARPEGGELALASLRGRPLLINFWATWCAPCLRELPALQRLHAAQPPGGLQLLGLAIDGPTPVREFLARTPVSYAVGLAGLDGTDLVRLLGNPQGALPFSVLLAADGRLLQRRLGELDDAALKSWADQAIDA